MSYIYYYYFQLKTVLLVVSNNIQLYSINRTLFIILSVCVLIRLNQSHYLLVLLLLSDNILPFTFMWMVEKKYAVNPYLI